MKFNIRIATPSLCCIVFLTTALIFHTVHAQTANERVPVSSAPFQYGVNPGYYGNGWSDLDLAEIAAEAGSLSFRASLPGHFVERWGYNIRVPEFTQYTGRLGMKGIAVFLGEPSESQAEKSIFSPATSPSMLFKNLYAPVWDNGENGTPVNDQNAFALYVYHLVQNYGNMVEYWEVINEPDFTSFWDNANRSLPNNWFDNAPSPAELPNLKAPVFHYIRMLRIAYEVIKRYQPDAYVTPGGLGHPAFLDALLRYTDNPDQGKVSSQYPLKGGAYFDVLSFHTYPAHNLSVWDNGIGGRRWFRHSDAAAEEIFVLRDAFRQILVKHGYDGKQYPAKPYILTEVGMPRKMYGDHYGGDVAQRNFVIKASVESQKQGLQQFHIFKIGESADFASAGSPYDLMGLYENMRRDKKGQQKLTQQGKALKTTSQLLYGWRYDSDRTQALALPAGVGGAAFKKGNAFRYVLWAKTTVDKSESAQAVYSFPPALEIDSVARYEWDFSVSPSAQNKIRAQSIQLTGTPSFFEATATVRGPLPVNILSFQAGADGCSVRLEWHISFDEPGSRISIQESRGNGSYGVIYSAALTSNNSSGSILKKDVAPGEAQFRMMIERNAGPPTFSEIRSVTVHCQEDESSFSIFPNPASDVLVVRGLQTGQRVSVFDNNGRKLKELTAQSPQTRVDLRHLPAGTYYLQVTDKAGSTAQTMKFVKK